MPSTQTQGLRSDSLPYRTTKRIIDFLIALVAVLALSPIFIIVAVLVALTSRGPVFYRQDRVGLNGRKFRIYKFRTMQVGADKVGPLVTSSDDTRFTRVGKTLRKTKLDELPQMLNVLVGDMSLVGPRPQVSRYVDLFEPDLREIVLSVRPGVTGITALAYRNEEEMLSSQDDRESFYIRSLLPVKLNMDAWYVQNRGLIHDLYLLNKTLSLLLTNKVMNLVNKQNLPSDHEITARVVREYCRFIDPNLADSESNMLLRFSTPQIETEENPEEIPAMSRNDERLVRA